MLILSVMVKGGLNFFNRLNFDGSHRFSMLCILMTEYLEMIELSHHRETTKGVNIVKILNFSLLDLLSQDSLLLEIYT